MWETNLRCFARIPCFLNPILQSTQTNERGLFVMLLLTEKSIFIKISIFSVLTIENGLFNGQFASGSRSIQPYGRTAAGRAPLSCCNFICSSCSSAPCSKERMRHFDVTSELLLTLVRQLALGTRVEQTDLKNKMKDQRSIIFLTFPLSRLCVWTCMV